RPLSSRPMPSTNIASANVTFAMVGKPTGRCPARTRYLDSAIGGSLLLMRCRPVYNRRHQRTLLELPHNRRNTRPADANWRGNIGQAERESVLTQGGNNQPEGIDQVHDDYQRRDQAQRACVALDLWREQQHKRYSKVQHDNDYGNN